MLPGVLARVRHGRGPAPEVAMSVFPAGGSSACGPPRASGAGGAFAWAGGPGAQGISDETGQAIIGKTCRKLPCQGAHRQAACEWAEPGSGAQARERRNLATVIPRSGALNQGSELALGGVIVWLASFKLHASVKKDL